VSTLLLRLTGPMQSWGTQSRFSVRDAGTEPSKSGVIGLLCAALGRPRWKPVDDLAALRMGVRVDQEGTLARDYQTTLDVAHADGSRPTTEVSNRYFQADADYLVGLEGDQEMLDELAQAVRHPHWQLSLGRKAFVPGVPVWIPGGLVAEPLEAVLRAYPWPRLDRDVPPDDGRRPAQLRLVLEADPRTGAEIRADRPIGAAFETRRFATRYVRTVFTSVLVRKEASHDVSVSAPAQSA